MTVGDRRCGVVPITVRVSIEIGERLYARDEDFDFRDSNRPGDTHHHLPAISRADNFARMHRMLISSPLRRSLANIFDTCDTVARQKKIVTR